MVSQKANKTPTSSLPTETQKVAKNAPSSLMDSSQKVAKTATFEASRESVTTPKVTLLTPRPMPKVKPLK